MEQHVSTKKITRLLEKALGEIFAQETHTLLGNMMTIVTEVSVSPDLGLAKVYLSFILAKDRDSMLTKVEQKRGVLRKLLGKRIGNKLRRVPELQFYLDNSAAHAVRIGQLLDDLEIPEDTSSIPHDE